MHIAICNTVCLGVCKTHFSKTCGPFFFGNDCWYTGGWNQEKKRLRKATVVPNEYPDAKHFGEGRVCAQFCSKTPCSLSYVLLNCCTCVSQLELSACITQLGVCKQMKTDELQEGLELVGTINRCMLFHGAQVDIGAEYDA